jgi:uncharacterized protein
LNTYLDTSVVMAMLTAEDKTAQVQNWVEAAPMSSLHLSPWVMTEVSSALSLKVRTDRLTGPERSAALDHFGVFYDSVCTVVPVVPVHFRRAADLINTLDAGLRGADALHLAIAEAGRFRIFTFDQQLQAAAQRIGVEAVVLG